MSLPEVGYRFVQRTTAQLQQFSRLGTARRVPLPNLSVPATPFLSVRPSVSVDAYVRAADRLLAGRMTIFDREYAFNGVPDWNRDPKTGRQAPLVFGKTLDYRSAEIVGDIKYLWEPNRHLHLVTLAQAYRLTGERQYVTGLRQLLESWLEQCPYLLGPNWTSSLELGIRLINWSVIWQLLGGAESALFDDVPGRGFRHRWLNSIYQHMHFIAGHRSRFSSANNHLIGELAGLYIAATTWPYWRRTSNWRLRAHKLLVTEALRQNAADGVNREQAIAYQQFVFDFLLLAALAGRRSGDEFPPEYWLRLEQMLEFIAALMDTAGNVPMIGDADDGFVVSLSGDQHVDPFRSLLATGAALFRRGDFKAKASAFDDKSRWLLGNDGEERFSQLPSEAPTQRLRRQFPHGGYYILGGDLETTTEVRIVADAGPLGWQAIAAHGHADALAFTLTVGGIPFLIDPGTYAYHTEREWRHYFRSTAAHNTLRVDGMDQSVSGGNFMWVKHGNARCEQWRTTDVQDVFVGVHDGYQRLPDPVRHQRKLVYDKSARRLDIVDTVECAAAHQAERCWHFADDVAVAMDADGGVTASKGGWQLRLSPSEATQANLYRGSEAPIFGWWSPRFSVKVPSPTVVWTNAISQTTTLGAMIEIRRV